MDDLSELHVRVESVVFDRSGRFLGRREPVQELLRDRYGRRDLYRMAHADLCRDAVARCPAKCEQMRNQGHYRQTPLLDGRSGEQCGVPYPQSVRGYRRGECQQCGSAMRKGYRPSVVAFLTTNEIIKVK